MIELRDFRAGDELYLRRVFESAIHEVAIRNYSQVEVDAWAPRQFDPSQWARRVYRQCLEIDPHDQKARAELGYVQRFAKEGEIRPSGGGVRRRSHSIGDMNSCRLLAVAISGWLVACGGLHQAQGLRQTPSPSERALNGLLLVASTPPSHWSRGGVAEAFGLQTADFAPRPWPNEPGHISNYEASLSTSPPFRVTLSLGYPDPWPASGFDFGGFEMPPRAGGVLPPLPYCVDALRLQAKLAASGWTLVKADDRHPRKVVFFEKMYDERQAELQLVFPSAREWPAPGECELSIHISPGTKYLP